MRKILASLSLLVALSGGAAAETPFFYGVSPTTGHYSLDGAGTGPTFPSAHGMTSLSIGAVKSAPSGFGWSRGRLEPLIDVENDRQNYGGR